MNEITVSNVAKLQNQNCATVSAPIIVKHPTSQTVCGGTFAIFSVSVSGLGSLSYKWNNGSTNSSIITNTTGIYFVTVTGINGYAISNVATLSSKNCTVTQLEELDNSKLGINVYPNPIENELTVVLSKLGVENSIELFNELGVTVASAKTTDTVQKLDLRSLDKGFLCAFGSNW